MINLIIQLNELRRRLMPSEELTPELPLLDNPVDVYNEFMRSIVEPLIEQLEKTRITAKFNKQIQTVSKPLRL